MVIESLLQISIGSLFTINNGYKQPGHSHETRSCSSKITTLTHQCRFFRKNMNLPSQGGDDGDDRDNNALLNDFGSSLTSVSGPPLRRLKPKP